jgi:hypothetical protein
MTESNYTKLASINVNDKIEKKNNLSYLSWAWAVDQLLRADPMAHWTYGEPVRWNDTVMVFCTVTAFGKPMTAQLPVMDYKNKAISNPDAFAVNTAMQRCLAKAIALHGLGLYIYAGEDVPEATETISAPREAAKAAATVIDEDRMSELEQMAIDAINFFKADQKAKCMELVHEVTDNEEKLFFWNLLSAESKMRAFIKAQKDLVKEQ